MLERDSIRPIDAYALDEKLEECTVVDKDTVRAMIAAAPTVEVEVVKYAEWILVIKTFTTVAGVDGTGVVGYRCSRCEEEEIRRRPYCGKCNSKMR